ncbi:hypothetical protein [Paraburkholderia heleia]|uniref:hypothetical protein n=1 Tax=Paraburkholderia heleia TaxID=634127 RepID=UPI0012EDF7BC|nr:hypothetical protein [Paraburkholderia heleia]
MELADTIFGVESGIDHVQRFHTMGYLHSLFNCLHRANRHPMSGFPLRLRNAATMRGLFLEFSGQEMVGGETRIPLGAPQELLPVRSARGKRGLAHMIRQGCAS